MFGQFSSLGAKLLNRPIIVGLILVTLLHLLIQSLSQQQIQGELQSLSKQTRYSFIEVQDAQGKTLIRKPSQIKGDESKPVVPQTKEMYPIKTQDALGTTNQGTIILGSPPEEENAALSSKLFWTVMTSLFTAWLIAILAIVFITSRSRKQLNTILTGVWRLWTGDFGTNIPLEQLQGKFQQLARLLNDVSSRLRTYEDQNIETLTFERNKMEAVLMSIAEGVLVADEDGTLVIMNDTARDMLDVSNIELIVGRKISDYVANDGDMPFESVIREYHKAILQKSNQPFVRRVEVSGRTFAIIISDIKDKDGHSLGFAVVLRDITRETEIDRLKTQFISNVSHELRTPVTTIKSYVDTLFHHGDELDETTYKEFMETINVETDRLKRMVNDILDFSRLESPEIKIEMDYQDITPIINLTVQSIKVLASQKNLTVTTAIESNLPKIYMNSDSIERALRNLLSNAIKYTPEGGRIKIRAEVVNNGKEIKVLVEDTGIGIPDEHLERIWDRFYRVENEVHTIKGTGLGLHLVRLAIEEHHKGHVFAESHLNKGTQIGFTIPVNVTIDPISTDSKMQYQPSL